MLMKSIVLLVTLGVIDAAAILTPAQQKQAENVLMLAEKMSDRQHEKYCQRFGEDFINNPELPKIVQENCIEKLVFNSENKYLPDNFPEIDEETSKKVVDIHSVCVGQVENPCIPERWAEVKKCINRESLERNLLNLGTEKSILPKNLGAISVGISSSLFKCTDENIKNLKEQI